MTDINKKPMRQISLKISHRQLEEIRKYAKQSGENPVSFHIRQAIHEYLQNKKECGKI